MSVFNERGERVTGCDLGRIVPHLKASEARAVAALMLHRIGVDYKVASKALRISVTEYYRSLDEAYDLLAGSRTDDA